MSEDLNNKLKQITDILSQENLPDNLKGLLSTLANTNPGSPLEKIEASNRQTDPKSIKNYLDDNSDMVYKIRKIVDRIGSNQDPRITLLNAIKPFLNNTRQKKLHSCMKLIHMTSIARLMDETDKSNF